MAKKKRGDTSIQTYREKRDFSRTPEPAPGELVPTPESPSFVIHRHEASHLHYDLRLEFEGVLKSFAVPKGFSYVPQHKHLAVRTEDHPLEYLDFHGVIPKGEYGAGTMKIWDRGTYEVVVHQDLAEAMEAGEIKVELDGARVRGQWHMVRTRKNESGKQQWLLFKHRDRYARGETDPAFPIDLYDRPRKALPARLKPMHAGSADAAFDDPEWVFELLFPGRRLLVRVDGGAVRFVGADGKTADLDLPAIAADLTRLRSRSAWLDGVLVATGEDGRPDPALLEERLSAGDTEDLVYYAFDLLHHDHWDLRDIPLHERKHALRAVIPTLAHVLPVDHVAERGIELMEVVQQGGLAGIVAKARHAPYQPGLRDHWRTIRAAGAPAAGNVLEVLESRAPRRTASRVKVTNRDKVYWPQEGITKGELLDYYDRIADTLLPYLRDRPAHMLRYPDGIDGKWFYQKNVTGRVPDWVHTVYLGEKEGEEVRYVVINDRDTLLHLVNLGSIDLHPWHSRVDTPESPDWTLLDLDPTDVDDFRKVIRIARELGKLLRGIGLRPVLKTSGATGLHIMVPFRPGYSYDQSRMFAEAVSRIVARELKEIATVERSVAKRESKVYIDFLQNLREQTIVPPYVVRPVPGATCSTPLEWDELDFDLRREAFTMDVVLDRVNRLGDLFRPCLEDLQDLGPAIEALSDAL